MMQRATSIPIRFLTTAILLCAVSLFSFSQNPLDSDADGLSDLLEQSLLAQFAPDFMVARHDCSHLPGEFLTNEVTPTIEAENGTIYGQVFLARNSTDHDPEVEIHYYHLWMEDCGAHRHPLDAEHVSVLVKASEADLSSAHWKAIYWYASAHENTVCDVSQIVRAATVRAEDHGAKIWVSAGKHASYLNETLCQRGCGADRCEDTAALPAGEVINLGEPGHPMNGSLFITSKFWPLADKMSATNFPPEPIERLNQLPDTDIAWYHAGRHPAQGIIAISSSTADSIANGGHNANTAISVAQDSTGNALQKSYRNTKRALGRSVRFVFRGPPPAK
jgi:hypothetical protein